MIKKIKDDLQHGDTCLCKEYIWWRLFSKIYKEFFKPRNEKTKNSVEKWAKDPIINQHLGIENTEIENKCKKSHSRSVIIRPLQGKQWDTFATVKSITLIIPGPIKNIEKREL